MYRTHLTTFGSLISRGPFTFIEVMMILALLLIIGSAVYTIYRKLAPPRPSWTHLTKAQWQLLSALRQSLLQCASSAGNTDLIRNLRQMRFGGTMTAQSAVEFDANAITVGKTTYFSPYFFSSSTCQQFRTMLHEASRVGGNYADEQNDLQGLIRLEQAEELSFRHLATCLGCCGEYPRTPPSDYGQEKRSAPVDSDSGLA